MNKLTSATYFANLLLSEGEQHMTLRNRLAALFILGLAAAPTSAADKEPCPAGLICASTPQGVVSALQGLGYKAVLGKNDNNGNPKIDSAASGYSYTLYFNNCEKNAACADLQFLVSFTDDGANTVELANKWNLDKRFLQASVDDKKTFYAAYDVTTVGGLTQKNFADVVDWWSQMLGELSRFFKDNPPAKK
jgi:hypothetical protein